MTDSLRWLTKLDTALSKYLLFMGSRVGAWICAGAIIVLLIANFITVVGRRSPWAGPWARGGLDLSELMMSVVSCCALAHCWYIGAHIRVDMIRARLTPKAKAVLDSVSSFLFFLWVIGIAYGVYLLIVESLKFGIKSMTAGIPVAPFQLIFVAAMLHFALALLRSIIGLIIKASGRNVNHEGLY